MVGHGRHVRGVGLSVGGHVWGVGRIGGVHPGSLVGMWSHGRVMGIGIGRRHPGVLVSGGGEVVGESHVHWA